jgi:DNA repair exonuclease SbcCD ATPase subunit
MIMLRELWNRDELEDQIDSNEKKLKALLARLEEVDQEVDQLFTDLDVLPEQIQSFIENKENFTEDNWAEIQRQLAEQKTLATETVVDKTRVRQVYKERSQIRPNWMFVR